MTVETTMASGPAETLHAGSWREFGGRMFQCNAAGRPIRYRPDSREIRVIVEECLAQRTGLGGQTTLNGQEQQRHVAGIVSALAAVVSQDVEHLDALEATHRLAAEIGQWRVSSALALDVAAMHAAARRLGQAATRQAVRSWVDRARPQPCSSIGDPVRVATERGHHAEGIVRSIDALSAEYVVALTSQDHIGPTQVTVPFESVLPEREEPRAPGGDDPGSGRASGPSESPDGAGAAESPEAGKTAFLCNAERVLAFLIEPHRPPLEGRRRRRKERELARWLDRRLQVQPARLSTPQEHQLALELRIVLRALAGNAKPDARTIRQLRILIDKCRIEARD